MLTSVKQFRAQVKKGGDVPKVIAALQTYEEHHTGAPVKVLEYLLYNVWKQCAKWLKLHQQKIESGTGSKGFNTRRVAVTRLRDEAMTELTRVSEDIAETLKLHETRKHMGPVRFQPKPLDRGYQTERNVWVDSNKTKVISATQINYTLSYKSNEDYVRALRAKGFDNFSVQDFRNLENRYGSGKNRIQYAMTYLNKIQRMQYMVAIDDDARLCDINYSPLLMSNKDSYNKYRMSVYAMDVYGNIFMKLDDVEVTETVDYNPQNGFTVVRPDQFNHSSFLAGKEAICAGCIHVGYNTRKKREEPGILSCIDNSSGHYKPTAENLRNCLEVLRDQGIDINSLRVADWSQMPPRFYWGIDFLNGGHHPWGDEWNPTGFLPAPPVRPGL